VARHFTLRKASEEDFQFLLELRIKSMEPHHAMAGIHQTEEEAMARVRALLEVAQVVEHQGTKIGMLKVAEESRALRIVQLQLLPEWQSQGIGTSLVQAVLERARGLSLAVTLSVSCPPFFVFQEPMVSIET
jgi:N-acetylglutamate synthase-like GNAT family acetyltransferase